MSAVKFIRRLLILFSLPIVLASGGGALGQSSDPALPTAILSNEVSARIPALDSGDPRLTRHYYAFEGTAGDLVISINSRNLNGDMDIFTAVTLRPLMKDQHLREHDPSGSNQRVFICAQNKF